MRISRVASLAWSMLLVGTVSGVILAPLAAARVGAIPVEVTITAPEAGAPRLRYRLEGRTYEGPRGDLEAAPGTVHRMWVHPRRPGAPMEGSPAVLLMGTVASLITSSLGLSLVIRRHLRERHEPSSASPS